MGRELRALILKDLRLELRHKHTLGGVGLYVASTVFVIYLLAGQPEARTWNALFWITQLFVAVNAVARSFLGETPERYRYYYTLTSPVTFLLAKLVYSVILLMVMSLVCLGLFALLLGSPLAQVAMFCVINLLGSLSLSTLFTFLSAIAARAEQNAALMAILGFPLAAPILLVLANLALQAVSSVYQPGWWSTAGILLLLDAMIVLLGIILFPFLWKE